MSPIRSKGVHRLVRIAFLAALLLPGCDGQEQGQGTTPPASTSAASEPVEVNVGGTWSGSWSSTDSEGVEGSMDVDWAQELPRDGGLLGGSITLEGSSCITRGFASGAVTGAEVSFSLVVEGKPMASFEGTVTGGTIDTISGTYEDECGDSGTWEIARSSSSG